MRKKVLVSLVLLSTVIVTGTLGYTLIEGWDLFDSLYMTIVTLTTIGYEEVHRLSRAGRVFNIFMILYGVGVVAYTVNFLIRFILEGEIQEVLGRRSMKKKLKKQKTTISCAAMEGWAILYARNWSPIISHSLS